MHTRLTALPCTCTGSVHQLKLIRVDGGRLQHELLDGSSKMTVIYTPNENSWIVRFLMSEFVYGGTESSTCCRFAVANWQGLSSAENIISSMAHSSAFHLLGSWSHFQFLLPLRNGHWQL